MERTTNHEHTSPRARAGFAALALAVRHPIASTLGALLVLSLPLPPALLAVLGALLVWGAGHAR